MAKRFASVAICIALAAGCAQTPVAPPPPPPAPAPEPPPPPPPPLVTPQTIREAQTIAEKSVIPLLESGKEDQAKIELERALIADPNNKLALSLKHQMTDDPVAALGRESFSYSIRPNESLSSIAAVFLKDRYLFYILARYNNIAVPRQVAAGQTIKVPGKAPAVQPPKSRTPEPAPAPVAAAEVAPPPPPPSIPPPAAAPAPPSPGDQAMRAGAAAEKSNDLNRALSAYQSAASLDAPGATAKVQSVTKSLVAGYARTARVARTNQNFDAAITAWDRVLALDPANDAAKTERAQVVELKTRFDNQGAPTKRTTFD